MWFWGVLNIFLAKYVSYIQCVCMGFCVAVSFLFGYFKGSKRRAVAALIVPF